MENVFTHQVQKIALISNGSNVTAVLVFRDVI